MNQITLQLLNDIKLALADPQAPWYGSNLVPNTADLCDQLEKLHQLLTEYLDYLDSGYDILASETLDRIRIHLQETKP